MRSRTIVMEEPGTLSEREVDLDDLGPGEALVRVELTGICGTDVHMNEGGMALDFPVVPGHEFSGEIESLGEGVATDSAGEPVAEGDHVTVVPGVVCGECWYCQNVPARPQTCENRWVYGFRNPAERPHAHGGMSEYVVVRADATFYRLPDGLDVELGALAEPLSVATHAFERAYQPGLPYAREGFGVGQSVAVQGAGPIGLLAVSAAKAAGAGRIIAIDMIDDRLDMAERFGATHTVDIDRYESTDELVSGVKGHTKGDVGPDVVIEAAGLPVAFRQGIELVRDGGTLVEVGHFAYAGEVEINPTRIVQKDLDVLGSLVYPPNQFETAIAMLDQLKDEVPFDELFNFKVGFDGVRDAYEKQASGEAYRATVHPGK